MEEVMKGKKLAFLLAVFVCLILLIIELVLVKLTYESEIPDMSSEQNTENSITLVEDTEKNFEFLPSNYSVMPFPSFYEETSLFGSNFIVINFVFCSCLKDNDLCIDRSEYNSRKQMWLLCNRLIADSVFNKKYRDLIVRAIDSWLNVLKSDYTHNNALIGNVMIYQDISNTTKFQAFFSSVYHIVFVFKYNLISWYYYLFTRSCFFKKLY